MSNDEINRNPNMRRNLLLCFDAFGTLFRPHSPIFEQYGSVARKLGVKVSDEEVAKSFKTGKHSIGFRLGYGGRTGWNDADDVKRLRKRHKHIQIMEKRLIWVQHNGGQR